MKKLIEKARDAAKILDSEGYEGCSADARELRTAIAQAEEEEKAVGELINALGALESPDEMVGVYPGPEREELKSALASLRAIRVEK